jgi:hypothetical protein
MLAVHRIFQMILGIIVSVLLLYFLISYAGQYKETQELSQRGQILKAFAQEARDVYLTGIPTNFTYFSRYDFSSCSLKTREDDVPQMECSQANIPTVPVEAPVIFYPGDKVYIGRDSLDYGWWTFNYAHAMPSLTFVFNPLEGTEQEWEMMRSLVEYLPDTSDEWSAVKVDFAFCSEQAVLKVCGGQFCSRQEFLSILDSSLTSTSKCTASLKKNMRLVTMSSGCDSTLSQRDVCISPLNSLGVGNAFIQGSARTYVWKDPLDLIALSLGGSEKDEFGKPVGEKIYDYKNSLLMDRLSLASEVVSKRSQLILRGLATDYPCHPYYVDLVNVLGGVAGKDYKDISQMYELNEKLNNAKQDFQMLADMGCERIDYGL